MKRAVPLGLECKRSFFHFLPDGFIFALADCKLDFNASERAPCLQFEGLSEKLFPGHVFRRNIQSGKCIHTVLD